MCFRDQIQSSLIATCQRVSCLRRVSSLFARAVAGHLPESSPKNSKSWHAQEKFYEVLGHKPEGFRQRSTVFFMFFLSFFFFETAWRPLQAGSLPLAMCWLVRGTLCLRRGTLVTALGLLAVFLVFGIWNFFYWFWYYFLSMHPDFGWNLNSQTILSSRSK